MDVPARNNINVIGNAAASKTMVFGHGFGTDQTSFSEVCKYFSDDYRIVLYDNVGGGKSAMEAFSPQRYQHLNGYVADLIEIFEYLNLKDVYYVGHSVNGMVSLLCSIERPEFFSKLVLLGASPRYINDPENSYTGGFNQQDLEQLYQAMSSNYYSWASGFSRMAMGNEDRPQLAEKFAGTLSAIRPDIAQFVAKAIFQSDHREDLSKTKTPVLVVQTSHDVAVPEVVGQYLHKHIKNSSYSQVNTEGHFPHMSAPKEVADAVKSFIQPNSE